MRRQLLIRFCGQCGHALVRTATGAVCPNGHGRIVPLCEDSRYSTYPVAQRVAGTRRYRLRGLDGEWRTVVSRPNHRDWLARRNARQAPDRHEEGWVIGIWRGVLLWFCCAATRSPLGRG